MDSNFSFLRGARAQLFSFKLCPAKSFPCRHPKLVTNRRKKQKKRHGKLFCCFLFILFFFSFRQNKKKKHTHALDCMSVRAVLTRCDFPWSQFITGWTYHSCESSLSSGCYILCGSLLWRRHVSFSSCYCTIVSKQFSAAQHSTIFIIKTLCQQTNVRLKFFSRRLLLTHTTSRPHFKNNNNNNNNKKCVCPLESGFYYMIACCCLLCETFFSKVVALGLLLRFIHRDHRLNRIGNIWNKCRPYDDVPISIWIEFEFVLQQTGSGRNLMLCTATAQHFRQYCRNVLE